MSLRPAPSVAASRLLTCVLALQTSVLLAQTTSTTAVEPQAAPAEQAAGPVDPLLEQINEAIEVSRARFLTAEVHTPWQIMHGILAFRGDYELLMDGKRINAFDYIVKNPFYRGEPWFEKTEYGGECHYFTEPYIFEGHRNQFFAIMSMSDLPTDFEFQTPDGPITVADLIENAKMRVTTDEEITWTLWALSKYLPTDAMWTDAKGDRWSMERLIRLQTRYKTLEGPCGGTHGLFSLTKAVNARKAEGREPRGYWAAADNKIRKYLTLAKSLQNRDGSFSSAYFKGRDLSRDFNKRIETTGHTLEFVALALAEDRLAEPWVENAVKALTTDLIKYSDQAAKCGPLYHAVDALVIYKERRYGQRTSEPLMARLARQQAEREQALAAAKPALDPTVDPMTEPEGDAVTAQDPIPAPQPEAMIDEKVAAELAALKDAEAALEVAAEAARQAREMADAAANSAAEAQQKADAALLDARTQRDSADRLEEAAREKELIAGRQADVVKAMRKEIESRQVLSEAEGEDEPLDRGAPRKLTPKNVSNSKPLPIKE